MRTFSELSDALGLRKFLFSPLGTLYFVPSAPGSPRVMVRRFDGLLPPALAAPYAGLITACADWVAARPSVAADVRVLLPLEVGTDFVARPHPVYHASTDSYDPASPPAELAAMHRTVAAALEAPATGERDGVVTRVLARSLLEPTGRTYYDERERRFVVVEPKIEPSDLGVPAG
ncbi:hypothetical protein [Kitasatospora sp. NPDC004289]